MLLFSSTTQPCQQWSQNVRRISNFLPLISVPVLIHTWAHAGNVLEHSWCRLHVKVKRCSTGVGGPHLEHILYTLFTPTVHYGCTVYSDYFQDLMLSYRCIVITPHGDINPSCLFLTHTRPMRRLRSWGTWPTTLGSGWTSLPSSGHSWRTDVCTTTWPGYNRWLLLPSSEQMYFIEHIQ